MAGPFSNPNSAAEIAGQQQFMSTGGIPQVQTVPEKSGLQSAAEFVAATSAPINSLMEDYYKGQLKTELQGVTTALRAANNPWDMYLTTTADADKDPIVKNAMSELKQMGAAVRQGRMPADFALDRMEQIVSAATAKVPAYSEELTQAARSYLGFDPQQRKIAEMMQPTPQQLADAEDTKQAKRLNLDINTYRQAKLQQFQIEFQKQAIDLELAKINLGRKPTEIAQQDFKFGEVVRTAELQQQKDVDTKTGNLIAHKAILESTSLMAVQLGNIQAAITAGGITNPEQVIGQTHEVYNALKQTTLANLPASVDPAPIIRQLDTQRDGLIVMINQSSKGNLDLNKVNAFKHSVQAKITNIPGLAEGYAIAGEKYALEYTDLLAKLGMAGEGGMEAAIAQGAPGVGIAQLGWILNGVRIDKDDPQRAMQFYIDGTNPLAESTRKTAVALGLTIFSNKSKRTGAEMATDLGRWQSIVKGDETLVGLSVPSVVLSLSSMKEVQPRLIQTFNTEKQATLRRYAQAVASGYIDPTAVSVSGGRIHLTNTTTSVVPVTSGVYSGAAGGVVSPQQQRPAYSGGVINTQQAVQQNLAVVSDTQGAALVKQLEDNINRLVIFGERYKASGVLPDGYYKDMDTLLGDMTKLALDNKEAQKPAAGAPNKQEPAMGGIPTKAIRFEYRDGKMVRVAE